MIESTPLPEIKHRLLAYFALAYLISWLFWVPLALSTHDLLPFKLPFVLFMVGISGPILSAIILTAASGGKRGVWALLGRLLWWRVGWRWYLVALLLPAVNLFSALALLWLFGNGPSAYRFNSWSALAGGFLVRMILLPMEEVGWRGYALPRLQADRSALSASLILAPLWGFWHLPLFFMRGAPQSTETPLINIVIYLVAIIPLTILFTWLYNSTNESLLLVTILHAAHNTTSSIFVSLQVHPPTLTLVGLALITAITISVVLTNGASRLSRSKMRSAKEPLSVSP